jgi:MFS family permease
MESDARLALRSILPSAFLPALTYEIGNGAMLPVVALTALHLGASVGMAGLTLTLLGVGQVLGDVPSSLLANRLGDRRAMLVAATVAASAEAVAACAVSLIMLDAAILLVGASSSTFYLARQSYVSDVVPLSMRARGLSTLAGSHRIGLFLGPFAGALAVSQYGRRAAFVVAVIACLAVVLLLVVVPDARGDRAPSPRARSASSALVVARRHRSLYARLGVAVITVGAARAGRQTVLSLWAAHIGLDVATTSIVFGIANAIDMVLFYPSGFVMDRRGRRAVALPSMLLLAAGTALIPLTGNAVEFALAACVISFGNGIGSGIMMTLAADSAPQQDRVAFLSVWRGLGDSGNALGPVVISVVAATTTLACGIFAGGLIGGLAAAGLARFAPRYSAHWRQPAGSTETTGQPEGRLAAVSDL